MPTSTWDRPAGINKELQVLFNLNTVRGMHMHLHKRTAQAYSIGVLTSTWIACIIVNPCICQIQILYDILCEHMFIDLQWVAG